jgi:adenylate kinase
MQKWIVTGVSGSERIELLAELKRYADSVGKKIMIHDMGDLIRKESIKYQIPIADARVLDMDHSQLRLLRAVALKEVKLSIQEQPDDYLHLIGAHTTFRWKGRLIPGISYQDVLDIKPNGFITIVHDVKAVMRRNKSNPKWDEHTLPNAQETQEWMMVEEFVTEVLAEVLPAPIFLVSRTHNVSNLADLFFSNKKKIYLSYPITAVEKDMPELLDRIQGPILQELEELFVVFNPLTIKDMSLAQNGVGSSVPELMDQLTPKAKEIIKTRTIERDFQFIDQSDAVVVFYLTDKVSPGVLAEVYYAHRNQKPVFMVFPGKRSPFIEDAATYIEPDIDALMNKLRDFATDRWP